MPGLRGGAPGDQEVRMRLTEVLQSRSLQGRALNHGQAW